MTTDLYNIMDNLIREELQRLDFTYCHGVKEYQVKAYWVGKIIRIDIKEMKEKE